MGVKTAELDRIVELYKTWGESMEPLGLPDALINGLVGAMLGSAPIAIVVAILNWFTSSIDPFKVFSLVAIAAIAVGTALFSYTLWMIPKKAQMAAEVKAELDERLSKYKPADSTAFETLVDTVRKEHDLLPGYFRVWVRDEHFALSGRATDKQTWNFVRQRDGELAVNKPA